jgi:prepilin-type processing-associated H-X9-DG protein
LSTAPRSPVAGVVGFDVPKAPRQGEDETLLARWARHRLEELVSSPVVRIDLVECAAGHRDRYGRRCGILYADGHDADGRDVASTMIAEGLAHPNPGPTSQPWCP